MPMKTTKSCKNNNYTLLTKEENFPYIQEMFLESSKIMKFKDTTIKDFFDKELYYEHAQYFITYLLYEETSGDILDASDDTLSNIKKLLDAQIEKEKENKRKNNREFTYNNYFKSHKPQADYLKSKNVGKNVESVEEMLKMIFLKPNKHTQSE